MSESLAPLHETLARIAEQGLALDTKELSRRTGISSVEDIQTLLAGKELADGDVDVRIRERLRLLCSRRLAKASKDHNDKDAVNALVRDIASSIGVSTVWARHLVFGEKTPSMKHGHRLTDYFGEPDGFLTETPAAALNRALQPYLQTEKKAEADLDDPLADLKERFGLVGVARRGEPLSREEAKRLAGLLADVLEQNMEDQS
ncbi:hypothetical protein ACFWCA_18980 [Streptomyces phaeochromogenes]|uniref:hypothetical protein n=1 Tax=Streptomyces phaeochromogenes TaxID=1923 RepID=UPI00367C36D1